MAVPKAWWLWAEWVLGEGRYKGKGPRSSPRPDVGYGAPGQKPVPQDWWKRLEAFLAKRDDYGEPGLKPDPKEPKPKPIPDAGKLSPSFHIREFDCKDGTRVPAIAVPAVKLLAIRILEPMRKEFGQATVMSGYRHRAYNQRIGGARFSQHIYDDSPNSVAADMIFAKGTPSEWFDLADQLGAGGAGRYPSFVHVDTRPGKARW